MDPGNRYMRGQPRGRRAPDFSRGWRGSARGSPHDVGHHWRGPSGHIPDIGHHRGWRGPPRGGHAPEFGRGLRGPPRGRHIPELFGRFRHPSMPMPDPSHFRDEDTARYSPEPTERWEDDLIPVPDKPWINQHREHLLHDPDDERRREHDREHLLRDPDYEWMRDHDREHLRDPDDEQRREHGREHFPHDPDDERMREHSRDHLLHDPDDEWREHDSEHHRLHAGEHWRDHDIEHHVADPEERWRGKLQEDSTHERAAHIDSEEQDSGGELSGLVGHIFEYNHLTSKDSKNDVQTTPSGNAIESQSTTNTMEANSGSATPVSSQNTDWVSLLLGSADINSYAVKPKSAVSDKSKVNQVPATQRDLSAPPPQNNSMFTPQGLSSTGSIGAPWNKSMFSQPPPQMPLAFNNLGMMTGIRIKQNHCPGYNTSSFTPFTPSQKHGSAHSFRPPVVPNSNPVSANANSLMALNTIAPVGMPTVSKTPMMRAESFTMKLTELSRVLHLMNPDRALSFSEHLERAVKRCKVDMTIQFYSEIISDNARITVHTGKLCMDGFFLVRSFGRSRENAKIKAYKAAHDLVYNSSAYPIDKLMLIKDPIEAVRTQINEDGKTTKEVDEIIKKFEAKPPKFIKKLNLSSVAETKRFNINFMRLIDSLKTAVRKNTVISSFFLTKLFQESETGLSISYSAQPVADESGLYHAAVYLGPAPLALASSSDRSTLKTKVFELAVQKLINAPIYELLSFVCLKPDMVGISTKAVKPKHYEENDEYSDGTRFKRSAHRTGLVVKPIMYDPAIPTESTGRPKMHEPAQSSADKDQSKAGSEAIMLSIDSWIETTSSGTTGENPIVLSDSEGDTVYSDTEARSIAPSKKRVPHATITTADDDPILLSDDESNTETSQEDPRSSSEEAISSGDRAIVPSNEIITETAVAETTLIKPSNEIVEKIPTEVNIIMPSHESVSERVQTEDTPVMPPDETAPETVQSQDTPIVPSNESVSERVQTEDTPFIPSVSETVQTEDTPVMPPDETTSETVQSENTHILPSDESVFESVQTEDSPVIPSVSDTVQTEDSPVMPSVSDTVQTEDSPVMPSVSDTVQTEDSPVMPSVLEVGQTVDTPTVPSNESVSERVEIDDTIIVPSEGNDSETCQIGDSPIMTSIERVPEAVQTEERCMPSNERASKIIVAESDLIIPSNKSVTEAVHAKDNSSIQENIGEYIPVIPSDETATEIVRDLPPKTVVGPTRKRTIIKLNLLSMRAPEQVNKSDEMTLTPHKELNLMAEAATEVDLTDTHTMLSNESVSETGKMEDTPIVPSNESTSESGILQQRQISKQSDIMTASITEPIPIDGSLIVPSNENISVTVHKKNTCIKRSNENIPETGVKVDCPIMTSNEFVMETGFTKASPNMLSKEVPPELVVLRTRKRTIKQTKIITGSTPDPANESLVETVPATAKRRTLKRLKKADESAPAVDLTVNATIVLSNERVQDVHAMPSNVSVPETVQVKESPTILSNINVEETVQAEETSTIPSNIGDPKIIQVKESRTVLSSESIEKAVPAEESPIKLETVITSIQRRTPKKLNVMAGNATELDLTKDTAITSSKDNPPKTAASPGRKQALRKSKMMVVSTPEPANENVLETFLTEANPTRALNESISEKVVTPRQRRTSRKSNVTAAVMTPEPDPTEDTPITSPKSKRLRNSLETEGSQIITSNESVLETVPVKDSFILPSSEKVLEDNSLMPSKEKSPGKVVKARRRKAIKKSKNLTESSPEMANESILGAITKEANPIILSNASIPETVLTPQQRETPKKSNVITESDAEQVPAENSTIIPSKENSPQTVVISSRKRTYRQSKVMEGIPEPANESVLEPILTAPKRRTLKGLSTTAGSASEPDQTVEEPITPSNESETVVKPRQRFKKSNIKVPIVPETHPADSTSLSPNETAPEGIVTPRGKRAPKKSNVTARHVSKTVPTKDSPTTPSNERAPKTSKNPRQKRTPKQSNVTALSATVPIDDTPNIPSNESVSDVIVTARQTRGRRGKKVK